MTDHELKQRDQTLALVGSLTVMLAKGDLDDVARRNLERDRDDLIERVWAERQPGIVTERAA